TSIKASHNYHIISVFRLSNNTLSRIRYFIQTSKRNLEKRLNLCSQRFFLLKSWMVRWSR
ncbi:hypothetical protein GW17_00058117, partial [Ensete ventricosum]